MRNDQAELIARPSPMEGIGGALRAAYVVRAPDLPCDLQRLLDSIR